MLIGATVTVASMAEMKQEDGAALTGAHTLTVLKHQVPLATAGVTIQLYPINVTQQNKDQTSRSGDVMFGNGCVPGSFPLAVEFRCDFVQLYLCFSNLSYV